MHIIINCKQHKIDDGKDRIAYETLAEIAGFNPARTLTICYASEHSDGAITAEQQVFLRAGMVINVCNTGAA